MDSLKLFLNVVGLCFFHLYKNDPGLGEEGAWSQHENDVEDGVDGVLEHVAKGLGGEK